MKYWQIDPINTKDHWLEIEGADNSGFDDDSAFVKWDGCLELTLVADGEVNRIHICDLDNFIARLEEIKKLAKQHFGPTWP